MRGSHNLLLRPPASWQRALAVQLAAFSFRHVTQSACTRGFGAQEDVVALQFLSARQ